MKKLLVFLLLTILCFVGCDKMKDPGESVVPTIPDVSVPTADPPIISYFHATPLRITKGTEAELAWSVQGATAVEIIGIGEVPFEGRHIVIPAEDITYTLYARNADNETSTSTSLEVKVFEAYNEIVFVSAFPAPGSNARTVTIRLNYYIGDADGAFRDGKVVTLFSHPQIPLIGGTPINLDDFERKHYEILELGSGTATLTITYIGAEEPFYTSRLIFGLTTWGVPTFYSLSMTAPYYWIK